MIMPFYNPVLLMRCGFHAAGAQSEEFWAVIGSRQPQTSNPTVVAAPLKAAEQDPMAFPRVKAA